jgi:hypothetical protein
MVNIFDESEDEKNVSMFLISKVIMVRYGNG